MAYSPAANINTGNLSHITEVYLSKFTGYDCSIIHIAPNVSDPAALGVSSVVARDKVTGKVVFAVDFPEGVNIESIVQKL